MTARCNLACAYCVLENKPDQIRMELDLKGKEELISHLYHNLNFRSLTLSGGEALIIGRNGPADFLLLLDFLRQFKTNQRDSNLRLQLYTNGLNINDLVADRMEGIIDEVSITIDSFNREVLKRIGRNRTARDDYFRNAIEVCKRLSDRGIDIKLHTVVSALNITDLEQSVLPIYETLVYSQAKIDSWKFYQYMSYDVPAVDQLNQISQTQFEEISAQIKNLLKKENLRFHFKNNSEMNESLFNILAYGNAQYMVPGDTWTTSRRTEHLCSYGSISELLTRTQISEELFTRYHSYNP
jgi:MoaA/NifB/PqqE/SkfB family radical SAM enzyme